MLVRVMLAVVVVLVVVVGMTSAQVAHTPYRFQHADGSRFAYGYAFPKYHAPGGVLSFLTTYGQPTFFSPQLGFGTHPQVPVVGLRSVPVPSAEKPQTQEKEASQDGRVRSSLSPLLKNAVDAGFVSASGISQFGTPQFDVSQSLAEDAGGVSELAYRLGAIPVAAVHDVQLRPDAAAREDSFAPVLVHKETPKVTRYTLQVPIQ